MFKAAHRTILAVRASRVRARIEELQAKRVDCLDTLQEVEAALVEKRRELAAIEDQLREAAG